MEGGQGAPPARQYIHSDSIPSSDLPPGFVVQEDWHHRLRTVHVPGLAFAIPMLPEHPDSIYSATPSAQKNGDGCFLGARYQGNISGRIRSPFFVDGSFPASSPLRPLSGLWVEIREFDGPFTQILAEGVTDAEGRFDLPVDGCALCGLTCFGSCEDLLIAYSYWLLSGAAVVCACAMARQSRAFWIRYGNVFGSACVVADGVSSAVCFYFLTFSFYH